MSNVRYQALGPLLAGEGSRAFLGLQISDDNRPKPIVLVWVPESAISDAATTARLAQETARAAALLHPNIIRVYGLVQLDEGLARVVEYVDGETVRRVLDVAGTLPPRYAAFVAAEAAMGVHFAHLTGNADGTPLVHGDIRPDTLLVSFAGVCKVSGYGALSVAPKEMHGKRVKGRRAYSAPEQVLGGREAAMRETDVYLLGILLYECLTGMIPFGEEQNFDEAVLHQPLRLNLDAIPPKWAEVIAKATAKKASERFSTALAFREAIERAAGGLPTSDEFGVYLKSFFPEADQARAARTREIEAGIAEFYRRYGPPKEVAPAAAEPAPIESSSVAPTSASAPSTPAVSEVGSISPRSSAPPERRSLPSAPGKSRDGERGNRGVVLGVLLGASIAFGVAGVWWGLSRGSAKPTSQPPAVAAAPQPASPAPAAPAKIGPEVADPESADDTDEAAPKPKPKPAEPPSLELVVTPPVNVAIDGKPVGKSPIHLALKPGKHTLSLKDSSKGISISRSIEVGASGKLRKSITVGKGSLTVNAPNDAAVFLDGRKIGTGTVSGFPVYEGNHRILVTLGKAKWQQPFSLKDAETMKFDVYPTQEAASE